jgi:hypothetical protein
MRPDGSDLPHGLYGGGGVAKALRDERLAQTPSTSNSSSFLYDGTDSSIPTRTFRPQPCRQLSQPRIFKTSIVLITFNIGSCV